MINTQSLREKIQNSILKDLKYGDEKPFQNPFSGDKAQVLQGTRAFNESPISPSKCVHTLTTVLFLITSGGKLTAQETTDLFFGVTKLFQSNSEKLRRMLYLLIKSLQVSETEIFIVTSSLTKDMNSTNDCFRSNSIRVLSRIVDPAMASQIERYFKTAIVDKNQFVASSALMCGINLFKTAPEVVRRWVGEVHEAVGSRHGMQQFHALALLYQIKSSDRLALRKVVEGLSKSTLRGALAECLLIKYAGRLLSFGDSYRDDPSLAKLVIPFLLSSLRNKSEMVVVEACKAICQAVVAVDTGEAGHDIVGSGATVPAVSESSGKTTLLGYDINPILAVLEDLLSSTKTVSRFAAVKILSRLAQYRSYMVSTLNSELEVLLLDSNRSIATLALTTLLKTGQEGNIERLIKQISTFVSDISDSFKQDVVKAAQQLCLTYPNKHKVLLSFLSSNLREEGSFVLKRDTVNTLILLTRSIPAAQESGLLHLCEFIEDCEFPSLSARILSFLGEQAPTTECPSKFIRFIYNRLILENALVRAAGVDSLSRIALKCPELRKDIFSLIECCLTDNDDEVRDRANLYYSALEASINPSFSAKPQSDLLSNDDGGDNYVGDDFDGASTEASLDDLLDSSCPVAVEALCDSLGEFIASRSGADSSDSDLDDDLTVPCFDISSLPTEEAYRKQKLMEAAALASAAMLVKPRGAGGSQVGVAGIIAAGVSGSSGFVEGAVGGLAAQYQPKMGVCAGGSPSTNFHAVFSRIRGVVNESDLGGQLIHSSRPQALTEREAEYAVQVIKHFFASPIVVFEFLLTNTLQDQLLEDVKIDVTYYDRDKWSVLGCVPASSLPYDSMESAFLIVKKNIGDTTSGAACKNYECPTGMSGSFQISLQYLLKEGDDIGFNDQYPVSPVILGLADCVMARPLRPSEFKTQWDAMEAQRAKEVIAKVGLNFKSINAAVDGIISLLNLSPCDNTEVVEPGKSTHTVFLSGVYMGGHQVLVKAALLMSLEHGCLLKVASRSKNQAVSAAVLEAFDL